MKVIKGHDIDDALNGSMRQYLVGDLKMGQELDFIRDKIEFGISDYNSYTAESPHYHTENTEYEYIISGYTKIWDLTNNEVYNLSEGDFYVISPNTRYAQKSLANTRILFVKSPGGDDKHRISISKDISNWLRDWEI